MSKFNYLNISNAGYIDELLVRYQKDPDSIDPTWRFFFEGIEFGEEVAGAVSDRTPAGAGPSGDSAREIKVANLILAYRNEGKLLADINPLTPPPSNHPFLELSRFGLTEADLAQPCLAGSIIGMAGASLGQIIAALKTIYCGKVAVETGHMSPSNARDWFLERVQAGALNTIPDAETRKFILGRLADAETFERFLHTRYVAQKRFSVEGGDSILPALDCLVESAPTQGAQEFVVGMAHRGRLSVLVHLFGKKVEHVFTAFEGNYHADKNKGDGDVKYHMGYSIDRKTREGKSVHLSMANNPSHLEFVNAVVEGMARAKQENRSGSGDSKRKAVIPVLIHGDAAFAGQGVNYEILNFEGLRGYGTGGTLHYVINNQVGFTTSPIDARSTPYCTDLARMLDAPILHVNGDSADTVWAASKLAIEFRQKFGKDVFIDLVCYRRHGHNEGDEPSFTQPLLYKKIKAHPSPREIYANQLVAGGVLTTEEAQAQVDSRNTQLIEAQARTKKENPTPFVSSYEGPVWSKLRRAKPGEMLESVRTQVPATKLKELAEKLNTLPAGFHLHSKLGRFFEARLNAVREGKGIDWGNGEALAYATLLDEGMHVRISGQDAERGTFTHRHAVLSDFETGQKITPHGSLRAGQGRFEAYNSHLSETGVMGFEFGYASSDPTTLVIWEAQFGDFANGAQVIIDQFIAATESKWQRANGLTLLLPHGYEGQGPEHSSGRLERFLQLCGHENMSVCMMTTPAQIFHALRRQLKRDYRKPLVVLSPKSLLRHPLAVSELKDFTDAGFQEVIDDPLFGSDPSKVKRVVLCSGKVYYDLVAGRSERKLTDVALVRLEQLYPFPAPQLAAILKRYGAAQQITWAQEEPRNMGAWSHVHGMWTGALSDTDTAFSSQVGGKPLRYAGRTVTASPAVGNHHLHEEEQKSLVEKALT